MPLKKSNNLVAYFSEYDFSTGRVLRTNQNRYSRGVKKIIFSLGFYVIATVTMIYHRVLPHATPDEHVFHGQLNTSDLAGVI